MGWLKNTKDEIRSYGENAVKEAELRERARNVERIRRENERKQTGGK